MQDANKEGGYIALFRKMLKWEWYDDINTKVVFIHLLLTANYKPKSWRGIKINRGQVLTSLSQLSLELGINRSGILRALKNLEKTGEIIRETSNKNTLITITKYDIYQIKNSNKNETEKTTENDEEMKRKQNEVETPAAQSQSGFEGNCETQTKRKTYTDETQTKHKRNANETRTISNKENKENKDKKSSKRARARDTPPQTEKNVVLSEQILIDTYGADTVKRYKRRFERWSKKKNISGVDCIPIIAEWIKQDGLSDKGKESNSSIDFDEVDNLIIESYKK